MNYAFGLEIIKVLTEGFGYAQPPSVGQFFTNGSHLPLPLFLPIPGALTYNMEFTGVIPVQKIQINSVLAAPHSICPALLGTLCPAEGLWSLLTTTDREANSSIALFSLF